MHAATALGGHSQLLFALLVGLQAAHSLEETVFGLYDLLPYINWIDRVRPGGAFVFFVVGNALFVSFGIWCYVARIRPKARNAGYFVMFWVIVETLNGILHPTWSLTAGTYLPGTGTAPFLLVAALTLFWRWTREHHAVFRQ